MPTRLAIATENLNSNLKRAISQAGQHQVQGVQLNSRLELEQAEASESSLRQIRQYVTERKMQVAGLFCPTRHTLYNNEFLEPRLEVIRRTMNIARTLQTDHVVVKCGPIPNSKSKASPEPELSAEQSLDSNPFAFASAPSDPKTVSPADQFQMLVDILNDLTQHGNHVGCRLALVLPNYNRQLVDSLYSKVVNGPLSIAFDPATAELSGESAVVAFRDLYQKVSCIRARDVLADSDGGGQEVTIGSGIVDWTHLIPTLAEADFDGWASVQQNGGPESADSCLSGVSRLISCFPQNHV